MSEIYGLVFAILGMASAISLSGIGSAIGIGISTMQTAGVLSEKPHLYGKLFVITALPGTQGFYGFIQLFWIATRIGLFGGIPKIPINTGMQLFFVGFGMGMVELISAIWQGKVSAAAINLVAEKEEEAGRAIILPGLVEIYAVISLIAAILVTTFITQGL
ncbi:MAG: V-type ATP synthase subunit K [Caldisericia bacterium]|jgi:V/A-type H+-transporting ATPase subunit K|nr:V-type ATP synthase subunit K [Caldisericia bacterium]